MNLIKKMINMFSTKKKSTGLIPQRKDKRDYKYTSQVAPRNIQKQVDLKDKFPTATQQNGYESCAAHAVCALMDYNLKYKKNYRDWDMNTSEAYLWYYARLRLGTENKNSGTVLRDYFKVIKDKGFVPQEQWDYSNGVYIEPDSGAYLSGAFFKLYLNQLKGYYGFTPKSPDLIALLKDSLTKGCPVVFGMPTDTDYQRLKKEDPYVDEIIGSSNYHAQIIVGYFKESEPSGEITYFIVRNSWGSAWGVNGYGYINAKVIYEKGFDYWTLM